eukprot:scaffold1307_cov200-Pinguiococcus_pyrenoidosus.AAC.52
MKDCAATKAMLFCNTMRPSPISPCPMRSLMMLSTMAVTICVGTTSGSARRITSQKPRGREVVGTHLRRKRPYCQGMRISVKLLRDERLGARVHKALRADVNSRGYESPVHPAAPTGDPMPIRRPLRQSSNRGLGGHGPLGATGRQQEHRDGPYLHKTPHDSAALGWVGGATAEAVATGEISARGARRNFSAKRQECRECCGNCRTGKEVTNVTRNFAGSIRGVVFRKLAKTPRRSAPSIGLPERAAQLDWFKLRFRPMVAVELDGLHLPSRSLLSHGGTTDGEVLQVSN